MPNEHLAVRNKPEYIICAAIHFDDNQTHDGQCVNIISGYVVAGRRHHNCFGISRILRGDTGYLQYEKEQGFITSKDRFITREEAWELAIASGQLPEGSAAKGTLFSEDLY